jgi:hypothetical protein
MSSVRPYIRDGWTQVDLEYSDQLRQIYNFDDVTRWCKGNDLEMKVTIVRERNSAPVWRFAFKNESDATMFMLKWK